MRSPAAVAVAIAVLAAGCGAGTSAQSTSSASAPTTSTAPADPGRTAIDAFVAAARAARADAMWRMLSTESRARLGPRLAQFRAGAAKELHEGAGSFRQFHVLVSERITPELGVVAIEGSRMVEGVRERSLYTAVLRLEGAAWKLELAGPVKVRAIGPDPGARERVVGQIAAAVEGPAGSGTAVMYLDGEATNPKVAGTPSNSTLYANFEPPLDAGRHTVVVFASSGREASAIAWAFTVTRG